MIGSGVASKIEGAPIPPLTGNNALEAALNHICTIYQKEELLDILEDDDAEFPFWKTDIADLLPQGDGQETQQSSPGIEEEPELPEVHGTEEWHDQLRALLREYKDIFSTTVKKEPAKVPPMKLEVNLQEWQTPKNRGPPRPQTPAMQQAILESLKKLLASNVIQPSQATEYSQVLLVKKPDQTWRFCIDYRALNAQLKAMGWPLPHIERMLRRLGDKKATVFAVLDLTSGYHQVLLDAACRRLAAFITEFGVFEPVRISMGLKTAPSYFQQQMAILLNGLLYEILELYLDDIIVFARSGQELVERLRRTFQRLREYNITLHPKKAKIGLHQLEYVGHVISATGLTMSPEKIKKVLDFPLPRKGKQLKQFLGLANYFSNHIRNYQIIAAPLHSLIHDYHKSRSRRIPWTEETIEAFKRIQEEIGRCPQLYFRQENAPTYLETDASDHGIGAYCYQIVGGRQLPLAFISKSLSKTQQRWATIEKECYAIWYAVRHLEHILRDVYFIIRTDHRNLLYLNTNSPKVVRWKLAIQEFNWDLEYVDGPSNQTADAFSRLCADVVKGNGEEEDTGDDDEQEAENAAALAAIVHASETNFVIPADKFKIISKIHNTRNGHFGVDLTMKKIKQYLPEEFPAWPLMREHVKAFIQRCPICQKLSAIKMVVVTKPFTVATNSPMERISIDTLGPFPAANGGEMYVLVVIDCFTRFVELYPTVSTGAEEAARHLRVHCGRYGTPHQIFSDRGSQFINEVVEILMILMGVEKIEGTPYSKEENSIVERVNKEVLRHLRAFLQDQKVLEDWVDNLPLVQRIINSTPHSSIGVSPAQLLFGNAVQLDRELYTKEGVEKSENRSTTNYRDYIDKMLALQSRLISIAQSFQKETDVKNLKKRGGQEEADETVFPVNSYVLVRYPHTALGHKPPTKLHSPWRGPLRVVNRIGSIYTLQDIVTMKLEDVHVTLLKPFVYDETQTDPAKVAMTDKQYFVVEAIRKHKGNPQKRSTLKFLVKWKDHDETKNTWEPWSGLRTNAILHEYLKSHKTLQHLVPEDFVYEE